MKGVRGLIYGFGINDAPYPVTAYSRKSGVRKLIWLCPYYRTWRGMLERVYSVKYHEKEPSYRGTILHESWHRFTDFKYWMEKQSWQGMEIDKDILSDQQKIYSPDTCIFIPKDLNQFLKDRENHRGPYLLGVSKVEHKYVSRCSDPFLRQRVYLGYYESEYQAHIAWKQYKHMLALKWGDILDSRGYAKVVGSALRLKYKELI